MARWLLWISCGMVFVAFTPSRPAWGEAAALNGAALYRRNCVACHGAEGRGDGPSATVFLSKPRDLRSGFLDKYSSEDLVRRILDGRQLSLGVDLDALRQQSKEVGIIDRHLRKLSTVNWLTVENGWALYADRCGACHGPFGRPTGELPKGVRAPRDLSSEAFQKSLDDVKLLEAVRHGRKGMPAMVPRLRIDEAQNVLAFVRILSPGFESYSSFCANCHGDDGVGVGNFDQTVAAPAVTFDAEYLAKTDPIRFRESIWHMLRTQKPSMPHFRGEVGEAEARAIIDYLRTLPAK